MIPIKISSILGARWSGVVRQDPQLASLALPKGPAQEMEVQIPEQLCKDQPPIAKSTGLNFPK